MKEIARLFLKLGSLGFGGPIAAMAMMENETVSKRKWLTPEHFARAYAMIKVLPGSVSPQMAIYLGQVRKGRWGGFVAGTAFVLPSFLLLLALSYFYSMLRSIPTADAAFAGMQAAALVVIFDSVFRMAQPYFKNITSVFLFLFAGILIFFKPRYEPIIVLGLGLMGAFGASLLSGVGSVFVSLGAAENGLSPLTAEFWHQPIVKVCVVCFKAGFLVFGTGLAIVPVLEADVVGHYHWLTHPEFVDGLALGQVTPGPVVITATFIGYKVAGFLGALLATGAIFLPGFINILLVIPFIEKRIENSPRLIGFTQFAVPTVIGGIVATSLRLGINTIHTVSLFSLLVLAGFVQFILRPPVWMMIPGCGLVYFFLSKTFS